MQSFLELALEPCSWQCCLHMPLDFGMVQIVLKVQMDVLHHFLVKFTQEVMF